MSAPDANAERNKQASPAPKVPAMTTDRDIPERWRERYSFWKEHFKLTPTAVAAVQIIEELGTAESLVRELARALTTINSPELHKITIRGARNIAREAIDTIPAHLRGRETLEGAGR